MKMKEILIMLIVGSRHIGIIDKQICAFGKLDQIKIYELNRSCPNCIYFIIDNFGINERGDMIKYFLKYS